MTKIVAAFSRKTNPPAKSKPVNAITCSLKGFERIAAVTSSTILSVRASEAPSGRITGAKYQPWSSSGTSDPGVMRQR